MVNGYNIDNPHFEALWRRLTRTQRQFVTHYHEYRSKKACAEYMGLAPSTVYGWEDYVWEAADLYEDHIRGAALLTLQDSVSKAALIKAAGLDSEDERVKQASATEILDRIFGKPKQTAEISGSGGGPVPVQVIRSNVGEDEI